MSIRTSEIKKSSEDLDNMLFDIMIKSGVFVPMNKNQFRFKNYLIDRENQAWNIYYQKKKICTTFLKVSAFAACRLHDQRKRKDLTEMLELDKIFQKNYLDILFYKHTLKNSKDYLKLDTALWRYEISSDKARAAKQKIDKTFYSSLT
jgi:hypothetical protein